MPLSIKDNSAWKTVRGLYVKDGGVWKTVQVGFIKDNGVWKQFFVNLITVNVSSQNNINLRTLYTNQTGEAPGNYTKAQFNINGNIGSSSTATAAMVTDTWPAGSEIIVNIAAGVYVVGAGGAGGNNGAGNPGGNAISLNHNITIVNNGIIGGGGGGGPSQSNNPLGSTTYGGGGGAGLVAGAAGVGSKTGVVVNGAAGSLTTGGTGYYKQGSGPITAWSRHAGGNLGQNGGYIADGPGGGAAGKAIALNGYGVTWSPQGTTYGSIS